MLLLHFRIQGFRAVTIRANWLYWSTASFVLEFTAALLSLPCVCLAAAFPDVAELLLEAAGATESLIVDAEIVAIDRENGNRIRAFQASSLLVATAAWWSSCRLSGRAFCTSVRELNKIFCCASLQELSTRARSAINSADVKVEVAVFVFDLLLINGEPTLELTLRERRERLLEALPVGPGPDSSGRC